MLAETVRNPDAARVGPSRCYGSRSNQRMRRARLDAGPCRSASPRASLSHCARESPFDVSPEQAIAAVRDLLGSIGHTCPECPLAWHPPRSADDQLVAMEIFFS